MTAIIVKECCNQLLHCMRASKLLACGISVFWLGVFSHDMFVGVLVYEKLLSQLLVSQFLELS